MATIKQEIPSALVDNRSILQVLGCLMKNPELLDEYKFNIDDFVKPFQKIIYSAIFNLHQRGNEVIDEVAIDSYCANFPKQYEMFQNNSGIEYVRNCIELSELENFEYNAQRVKKYACLIELLKRDLDITHLFNYKLTDPGEQEKEYERFDRLSIDDVIDKVEQKLVVEIRDLYSVNGRHEEFHAGDGLEELKKEWQKTPDIGLPFVGQEMLSTITRGARLSTIYLASSPTGQGKSRLGIGKMCGLSIPWYYNSQINDFEYHNGLDNPCLVMQTELNRNENLSLPLAYVSDVNENTIRTGRYKNKKEEARVDKAIEHIKQSSLYFDVMTDFTISDVIKTIKKYKKIYGVNYFFFDYLSLSPSIIAELGGGTGVKLREDLLMLLCITRLKNLCNEMGVFLYTSTQLNDNYKTFSGLADQSLLRSAKSQADKIDAGWIGLQTSEQELKSTSGFVKDGIINVTPNVTNHIYKVRGGMYSRIKIFQKVDLGTCRARDLFVTNAQNVFMDIPVLNIQVDGKINKRMEKKIEDIIDENSISIEEADQNDVSEIMNPNMNDVLDEAKEEVTVKEAEQLSEAAKRLSDMGW